MSIIVNQLCGYCQVNIYLSNTIVFIYFTVYLYWTFTGQGSD